MTKRRIIAVDFDGVLNKYNGWDGEDELYSPQSGCKYFLRKLHQEYDVVIFSCRDAAKIREWLKKYELNIYVTAVTHYKPKAHVYIDDRAIRYNGSYDEVLKTLNEFKTWWE